MPEHASILDDTPITRAEVLTEAEILGFIAPKHPDVRTLQDRLREIGQDDFNFWLAPDDATFVDRIMWPLRRAKVAYMIGDALGAVTLCGTVAEMVAVLIYDIAAAGRQPTRPPHLDEEQRRLFGATFDRLTQTRRVDVLTAYRLVDRNQMIAFEEVRRVRNRYLHAYQHLPDNADLEARLAYAHSMRLALSAVATPSGMLWHEGKPEKQRSFATLSFTEDVVLYFQSFFEPRLGL